MYNADDALSNWSIRIGRNKVDSALNQQTVKELLGSQLNYNFLSFQHQKYFVPPNGIKTRVIFYHQ